MLTRSRASYVSALDPSCPVKSEATMPRFNHLIIDQDIQFSKEGFQFFRHKSSVGALRL